MTEPRLSGVGAGPARSIPPGDDWISRRFREHDQRITQNLAAMRVVVEPLAQAITDLAELISTQVIPGAGSAVQTLAPPFGVGTYAPVSISVPAGFTRATVLAIGTLYAWDDVGHWIVYGRMRIAGDDGFEDALIRDGGQDAQMTLLHVRTITGLSGGSIEVSTRANRNEGAPTMTAHTTALVFFTR